MKSHVAFLEGLKETKGSEKQEAKGTLVESLHRASKPPKGMRVLRPVNLQESTITENDFTCIIFVSFTRSSQFLFAFSSMSAKTCGTLCKMQIEG